MGDPVTIMTTIIFPVGQATSILQQIQRYTITNTQALWPTHVRIKNNLLFYALKY